MQSLVWGSKPQQCKSLPCRSLQGTAKQSRGRSSPDDVWPLLGRRNVRKGPWGRYARESAEGAGAIDGVAVQRPVCLTRYNQTVCVHPGKVMDRAWRIAREWGEWRERERARERERVRTAAGMIQLLARCSERASNQVSKPWNRL